MSTSDAVDRRYRLVPSDLGSKARQVTVKSVTIEGVERLTPLVYFEGIGRPLALDQSQRTALIQAARSAVLADWVGVSVILRLARIDGQETILITPLQATRREPEPDDGNWSLPQRAPAVSVWTVVLLALLLLAAFVAVYAVENTQNLFDLFDVLTP